MVFVDGLRMAVRTQKSVLKKCIYTVLGVGVSGRQKVLRKAEMIECVRMRPFLAQGSQ